MTRPSLAVATILFCSLIAVSPLLAQGQETDETGAVGVEEEPTQEVTVSKELTIIAEGLWAAFNLAVGFFLWIHLSGLNVAGDMTIAWFLVCMRIIEGVAFVLFTVNLLLSNKFIHLFFLLVQVTFHAPLLWAVAVYIRKHDRPKSAQSTLNRVAPMMVILALAILLFFFALPGLVSNVFTLAFEPPLVFQALYMVGLWFASCRPTCRDPRIQTLSAYLSICALVGFAAHVRHVIMIRNPQLETEAGMVMNKLVEATMIAATTFLIVRLAEIGAFNDARHLAGSPWATESGIPLAEGTQRFIASSERMWSFSFIFYFAGFLTSGYCLFFVIDFDTTQDPMIGFFKTMHPCILLDYAPGTLFAQPLFDVQLLIIFACFLVNFMRHVLGGRVLKILLSGGSMTFAVVIGACFNLVFTHNPREISVIAHSIPYMFLVALQGTFIMTEAMLVFADKGYHKYPLFALYAVFVVGFCIHINYFMTDRLIADWSRAIKPMAQWTEEERNMPRLPFKQLMRAIIKVFLLDAVFIMWYRVNPLAATALAFDVTVTNRELDEDAYELEEQEEMEQETTSGEDARILPREAPPGAFPAPREAAGGLDFEATQGIGRLGPTSPVAVGPGEAQAMRSFGRFGPTSPVATGPVGTQQAPVFYDKIEPEFDAVPLGTRTSAREANFGRVSPEGPIANGAATNGLSVKQDDVFYNRPMALTAMFAAGFATVGLSVCIFFNVRVYSERTLTWREAIYTFPGSSILVVFWIFAAAAIALNVASSILYQELTNDSRDMVTLTWITGGILFICTLMAHGGTIAGAEEWVVYDGPRFFCTGLIAWTVKDILLVVQDWPKLRPTNAVPDLVISAATVILCLLEVARPAIGGLMSEERGAYVLCLSIIVKSICDSRGARIIISNLMIVPWDGDHCCGCCPPAWTYSPPVIVDGKGL